MSSGAHCSRKHTQSIYFIVKYTYGPTGYSMCALFVTELTFHLSNVFTILCVHTVRNYENCTKVWILCNCGRGSLLKLPLQLPS